jgi:hypothetical protein
MPIKPDKSLLTLGKYLSLALILPACVFAGYFLATIVEHWIRSPLIRIAGIVLGMAAGLMQIFRELDKETKPKP